MHRPWTTASHIESEGIFAIVRAKDAEAGLTRSRALIAAGIRTLEVSLTTPGALTVITTLTGEVGREVVIGAGTVLDEGSARLSILAGAKFLVSPTLSADAIRMARRYATVTIVGCSTPTEMLEATTSGADFCKIFPASTWTPAGVAQLLEALPQLAVVPTGGVTIDAAPDWLRAGAAAVGMGGGLAAGDDRERRERIVGLRSAVARARGDA